MAAATSHLRRLLHRHFSSSPSSILNPSNPTTPLSSKEKSRAALSLLKSASDPDHILSICRAASLSPSSSHLDRLALSLAVSKLSSSTSPSSSSSSQTLTLISPLLSSPSHLPHAIVLLGQAGLFDDAVAAFKASPSLRSFNSLLFAAILANRHADVSRLFRELPISHSITPNLTSYNTIVKAFSESGSSRSVFSVLEEMSRSGIKPNKTTFCSALAGLYKEEKFDDVEKLLVLMRKHGCGPRLTAYNVRIQSLCKLKRSEEAKALLKEMAANGMKWNWVTYNHLIYGFCKEGNLEEAKRLYKEMRRRGFVGDSNLYFTYIYYLCQGGEFEEALGVCKVTMARNWVPCFSTMKMLVNGLASSEKIEEAREIIEKMKEKFPENVDTWKEVEEGLAQ
ncbi:pentatricopeptide repeat-containing protein At1g11630, mitochondrial [Typha angustifolia]|uniref:pentatricopeptide repeat-containing protein At1g11630, mitochondrial n=1 Tax=Typha angustifolia TaxID=59011 RepID=UPI003C2BB782